MELRDRYKQLTDEELSQLYKDGGLTEEAITVLNEELEERNLSIDKIDEVLESKAEKIQQEYLASTSGMLVFTIDNSGYILNLTSN